MRYLKERKEEILKSQRFQQCVQLLRESHHLEFQDILIQTNEDSMFLQVKDPINNQEFSLLFFDISENNVYSDNNNNSISIIKLKMVKKYVEIFQQNQTHSNIIKYYKDFQIGNFYFVQIERFKTTLQQWVDDQKNNNQKINKQLFLKLSFQMMAAIKQVHINNLNLPGLNLKKILLTEDENVKLFNTGNSQIISQSEIRQKYSLCQEQDELFYYPKEWVQGPQNIFHANNIADMQALGVCLYCLAGASNQEIRDFSMGIGYFTPVPHLGISINTILIYLLQQKSLKQRQPSIYSLIQSFQNINEEELIDNNNLSTNMEIENEKKKIVHQKYMNSFKNYFVNIEGNSNDDALASIKECIQLNEKCDILYYYLGKLQAQLNLTEEALISYEKAISLNPQNDNVIYNVANIYKQNGLLPKAIDWYQKTIQINPKHEWAYNNMGNTYKQLEKLKEAIDSIQKCIQIDQCEVSAYHNLGLLYVRFNQMNKSIHYYKRASQMNPMRQNTQQALTLVYSKKKQYEKSIRIISKELTQTPEIMAYFSPLLSWNKKKM